VRQAWRKHARIWLTVGAAKWRRRRGGGKTYQTVKAAAWRGVKQRRAYDK